MIGTIINVATVLAGSTLGLLIHSRLPKRITDTAFLGIGLFTLFLGFSMSLQSFAAVDPVKKGVFLVIMIFSVVPGSIIGELVGVEGLINGMADYLKKKVRSSEDRFSEGVVTAFLLFCMGSMTILGAIEEGLGKSSSLLVTKAVLDGFSSFALAASLGVGVLFSVVPLFLYQAGITLFAASLKPFFTELLMNEMTAVGGLLIIGLGFNLLNLARLPILNMLPSLIMAVVLSLLFL